MHWLQSLEDITLKLVEMKSCEGIDGVIGQFTDILTEAGDSHIREVSLGKEFSKGNIYHYLPSKSLSLLYYFIDISCHLIINFINYRTIHSPCPT